MEIYKCIECLNYYETLPYCRICPNCNGFVETLTMTKSEKEFLESELKIIMKGQNDTII